MKLLDLLFGCTHKHYTFPMSARAGNLRPAAAKLTGAYVVCLECGKEFPYDWKQMRRIPQARGGSASVAGSSETVIRAA